VPSGFVTFEINGTLLPPNIYPIIRKQTWVLS